MERTIEEMSDGWRVQGGIRRLFFEFHDVCYLLVAML